MKRNGTPRSGSDKRESQTFDGETGKADPPPATGKDKPARRIDLSSLRDVRLELAAVYRQMDAGEIPSQDGTRRAYVLKTIADVITLAEWEKRIQELEEQQARQGGMIPGQRALSDRTLN